MAKVSKEWVPPILLEAVPKDSGLEISYMVDGESFRIGKSKPGINDVAYEEIDKDTGKLVKKWVKNIFYNVNVRVEYAERKYEVTIKVKYEGGTCPVQSVSVIGLNDDSRSKGRNRYFLKGAGKHDGMEYSLADFYSKLLEVIATKPTTDDKFVEGLESSYLWFDADCYRVLSLFSELNFSFV